MAENTPRNYPLIELSPDLFKKVMLYMDSKEYSEKTKVQYLMELKNLFKYETLTQITYNKYFQKGGASRATVNLIIKTCWFNDIPHYHYKSIDPTASSKREKTNLVKKTRKLTEQEILKLASIIRGYGLLVECAYYIGAGLRFSSAIRLKWSDFRWESWKDNRNKPGKCGVWGKGSKTEDLVVHPYLMNKLYEIAKSNNSVFQEIPYKNRSGELYLFITDTEYYKTLKRIKDEELNKILDESPLTLLKIDKVKKTLLEITTKKFDSFKYELNKCASEFGLPRLNSHIIRKSAATNLRKKGWPLEKISKMLMHESISTTQIYTEVEEEEITEDYEKMLEKEGYKYIN